MGLLFSDFPRQTNALAPKEMKLVEDPLSIIVQRVLQFPHERQLKTSLGLNCRLKKVLQRGRTRYNIENTYRTRRAVRSSKMLSGINVSRLEYKYLRTNFNANIER